ncbi:MAG: hypothetical protein ACRD15_16190 [Vicinamibacterales bacterium]
MTTDRTQRLVRSAVTASAMCFAAIGVLLLFAPEASGQVARGSGGGPLAQLLGAALLGFGTMNWIARGSTLGGIYGRAVVAANQTHLTIGALLLLKHGFVQGGSVGYWILTSVYTLGACLFVGLLFGGAPKGH